MKLPWRTRVRAPGPVLESRGEDVVPPFRRYRSPGLEAIFAGAPSGDAGWVLDLGPAIPENVDFLEGRASRIQIVDALRESPDIGPATAALRDLVSKHQGAFHMVLLWNCLDYLSPAQGGALLEAVLPLCRPGARCLAMVAASETMPASPTRYRIVDDCHLTYETSTTELLGAPQMTPATVDQILGGFAIEHAFVLRNGVREFVAIRDAAGTESLKR